MAASAMMMERTGMGNHGMGISNMVSPAVGTGATMPMGGNFLMVPRCSFKFEKCSGGMKIHCICDDKVSASMVQNLCTMMMGGMCSCCVMMNGMPVCTMNLAMGMCKVEMTETGVCIACTSGDANCCMMIQSMCDCCCNMMQSGCTCCVMMNNSPIRCGGCEMVMKKK